jgi:hypothetical protein
MKQEIPASLHRSGFKEEHQKYDSNYCDRREY